MPEWLKIPLIACRAPQQEPFSPPRPCHVNDVVVGLEVSGPALDEDRAPKHVVSVRHVVSDNDVGTVEAFNRIVDLAILDNGIVLSNLHAKCKARSYVDAPNGRIDIPTAGTRNARLVALPGMDASRRIDGRRRARIAGRRDNLQVLDRHIAGVNPNRRTAAGRRVQNGLPFILRHERDGRRHPRALSKRHPRFTVRTIHDARCLSRR